MSQSLLCVAVVPINGFVVVSSVHPNNLARQIDQGVTLDCLSVQSVGSDPSDWTESQSRVTPRIDVLVQIHVCAKMIK